MRKIKLWFTPIAYSNNSRCLFITRFDRYGWEYFRMKGKAQLATRRMLFSPIKFHGRQHDALHDLAASHSHFAKKNYMLVLYCRTKTTNFYVLLQGGESKPGTALLLQQLLTYFQPSCRRSTLFHFSFSLTKTSTSICPTLHYLQPPYLLQTVFLFFDLMRTSTGIWPRLQQRHTDAAQDSALTLWSLMGISCVGSGPKPLGNVPVRYTFTISHARRKEEDMSIDSCSLLVYLI